MQIQSYREKLSLKKQKEYLEKEIRYRNRIQKALRNQLKRREIRLYLVL